MIASFTRGYVYVAIPRTASRSMAGWLVNVCDGEAVAGTDHHSAVVPEELSGLRVFVVVRHPVDRLASLVRFHSEDPETWNEHFSRWLERTAKPQRDNVYQSQARFADISGASWVVRFEDLPRSLGRLWFLGWGEAARFPRVGVEEYTRHEVSARNVERIEAEYAEDFDRFDYARQGESFISHYEYT